MSERIEQVSKWFYQGLWGVLTQWFRVPAEPPTLPVVSSESIRSFRPAEGFLRYLKFQFWIGLSIIDGLLCMGWFFLTIALPLVGFLITPVALALIVAPDIAAYLAIHLRYDTTWYVVSDRSLRIRRGIWIIHETTITFENVQNVTVNQGPLQRFFEIADVIVQTAGGGGSAHGQEGASMGAHHGLIEGVANAPEIRDLIMSRLKTSRTAGLGDEVPHPAPLVANWSPGHVAALCEIRDAARELVQQ